jgi:8-amino-7-oxononanoate synthase
MTLDELIKQELEILKEQNSYRSINSFLHLDSKYIKLNKKKYINLSSNDYLSLSSNKNLKLKILESSENYLTSHSSSRLITGSSELFEQVENKISEFKSKESALIFNSGYSANLGIIQSLTNKNSLFLVDKNCHASIIDGIRLGKSDFKRFKHNDLEDLEKLLEKSDPEKIKWVLVESVYSMDGDILDIIKLVGLKKKYKNTYLYIDEAHGTGVFGKTGKGLTEGFSAHIDIIIGTFGKALAGFGAFVACSKNIREYLINNCRSFIYSTALAPINLITVLFALKFIAENPNIGNLLLKKSLYVRDEISKIGYDTLNSHSQIIPIILGSNKKALELSEYLKSNGYWAQAIRYPSVSKGSERVRLSLTAGIEETEINQLLLLLNEYKNRYL